MPVVAARKALQDHNAAIVLVDNYVAAQNLQKMAEGTGLNFSCEKTGDFFKVRIAQDRLPEARAEATGTQAQARPCAGGKVALITSDRMGSGADDLGRLLLKSFIYSLAQLPQPPSAIIFINSGALLTAKGSGAEQDLKSVEEKGARVLTCGACASYYGTAQSLGVGSVTDMMAIAEILAEAQDVITI